MSLCSASKTFTIRARMLILALISKLATFSRAEELAHRGLHRRLVSTFGRGHGVGIYNCSGSSFNLNIYLKLASSSSRTDDKLKTCFSQIVHRDIIWKTRLSENRNPFCHEQSVRGLKGFSNMRKNSHGSSWFNISRDLICCNELSNPVFQPCCKGRDSRRR